MRFVSISAMALLAGCGPNYTWQNSQLSTSDAPRQFKIDQAECAVLGLQSIPVAAQPSYSAPPAIAPQSRVTNSVIPVLDVNGNVTLLYSQTSIYPTMMDSSAQAAQALANFQAIQDNARRNKAYAAQDAMAEACLARRGWQQVIATE